MALQYLLAPTFQFVNTAGKPLSGGAYMEVYVHGTRTKYFCASDFDGTLHPFRIPLDSLGSNIVLANDTGSYDVYAYNRYGTLMMSRYNVKPGAGGGIGGTITSTDGSIDIHPTEDGVDLSVNGLDPSCLKVSADPRTTDGKFHFDTLVQEGDQAYVDNEGAIRLIKGWYHFTANVQLAWTAGARNETHQITLYTTLSNSVIDFDISHVHTETIELSGDVSIAQDGSELVIGVSGIPTGLEASVIGMDVHAITGKDGHDKYYAGNGITISNENYIAADFDSVQEKLVAGDNISITGNVISATSLVQVNSDWDAEEGEPGYIENKPNLDVYATQAQLTYGLAGKQDVISDLSAIRSGAAAGSSAVQPADLAAVATTGDYNNLNNRPNLTVYATKTEVNTGLAAKQDVISDLATIRSGAQLGSTSVQPADLNSYATDAELTAGLSTKQDTINDLSSIRSGAAAGSTALQPSDVAEVAVSGDYADLINKPTIPTKTSDLTNDSGFITASGAPVQDVQVDGTSVVNAQGIAEITMPTTGVLDVEVDGTSVVNAQGTAEIDLSGYATTQALTTGLAAKQDAISDLSTIRSGAAAGATAVQDPNYVHTDNNFTSAEKTKLSGIEAGAQVNVKPDWNAVSGSADEILNKPILATVASTGAYSDLTGTPTIPTVSDNVAKLQYGVATYAQVVAAFNAGKSIYLYNGDTDDGVVSSDITFGDDGAEIIFSHHNAYGAAGSRTEYKVTSSNVWSTTTKSVAVPTVDQSYSSSSANAQSGIAVAQAIAAIPSSSYTAGTGIDITNNVVSVDNTVVAMKSDLPTATSDLTNDSGFITLSDVPAQVNADWNSSSGASEILNKPTIPSGTQLVPAATSADADKVLTVDAQGTPSWATAQAPLSAGDGISISAQNEISVDYDTGSLRLGTDTVLTTASDYALSSLLYVYNLSSISTNRGLTMPVWNGSVHLVFGSNSSNYAVSKQSVRFDQGTMGNVQFTLDVPALNATNYNITGTVNQWDPAYITIVGTSGDTNSPNGETAIAVRNPNSTSDVYFTGIANGNKLTVLRPLPASTVGDATKVLKVNSSGAPEWATGGGDDGADWTAEQGEPGYIENKPVPKTLTAGTGISITENQSTITIANTATPPTVDQSYDASSTHAQSGTAVADALASLGTDRTVIMNTPQASSTSQMTLTEPFSNFEYIEIYATWDYNTVQRIQAFARFPGNQIVFNVSGFGCANLNPANYGFFFVTLDCSVSGTTITVNRALRALADNTLTSNTDSLIVQKIVGVHRIASN